MLLIRSMADDGSSGHCSSVPASTPSVCNSRNSVLIPITFDENGQPIGQEAAQLISLIGRLVKTYVPPFYVLWKDVPIELKEKIWKEVSGTYTIDLIHRHHILQRANKLWKDWKYVLRRDHIYKYLTDAKRKSHVPEYVNTEDWLRFVDISSTEAALAANKVGRIAWSKMKSPHTTNRKGYARVATELRPNEPVTRMDVFLATHKRKDGSSSSPEADAVITASESDRSVVESDIDNDAVAKGDQTIGGGRSDQREQKRKKDREGVVIMTDKGKSKVTEDIDRAQWSDSMGKCLIDICLEQVKSGGRPGIQFSSRAWKMIIEKFTQRTGHRFNQKQLKNQLDNLKKLYNAWLHLTSQTGIGFNPHTGCVGMEQDRWTEYLKTHRYAKVFKSKLLPFPEEMAALFDGTSTSNDAVDACIIDPAASVKASNQLVIASVQSEGPTINDCIDVLNAMPEISEANPLHLIALTCFLDKDKRSIWVRLRTNEGKMAWLKNQLQLEKGNASGS